MQTIEVIEPEPCDLGTIVADYHEVLAKEKVICTCKKIKIRMACIKCGYPQCEADVPDNGIDCGCTSCGLE